MGKERVQLVNRIKEPVLFRIVPDIKQTVQALYSGLYNIYLEYFRRKPTDSAI